MRLALALLAVSAACADPGRDGRAAATARRYAEASEPRAAYDLLSSAVRRRVSFEDFAARWTAARVERARQASALDEALRGGATLGERARLHVGESQVAMIVREGDGWRLETALLPASGARTPAEALRRFADALDERSFGALVRLLSTERQEGVRQTLDSLSSGLRAHLDESIEVTSDRATLVWTDGTRRWRIVLKREQGSWRIDDFSQQ
jgi:hypothetical protein